MSSFDYGDANPYGDQTQQQQFTPSVGASSVSDPAQIQVAPGYTPDYSSLLQSSPVLSAAKSAADANQQSADAARRSAVQGSYVQYGGDLPAGWTDKYGDIDQATQDAAKNNQFSTIANLQQNYAKSVDQFKKALAARGMLQSGELNYGQNQLDQGLGQQRYDAGNAFLRDVGGDYSTYAGVLGQNARDLASAVGSAQTSLASNPTYAAIPPTVAHYDSTLSAQYGKAVYSDEWGTLYDQLGNVLKAGTPPPPPPPPPAPTSTAPADDFGASNLTGPAINDNGYTPATYDAISQPVTDTNNVATAPVSSGATYGTIQQAADTFANSFPTYTPTAPVSGYSQKSKANLH